MTRGFSIGFCGQRNPLIEGEDAKKRDRGRFV
jgi:hypothetical protein